MNCFMENHNRKPQHTHAELQEVYGQVPPSYWDDSYRTNIIQRLYHDLRFRAVRKMLADLPRDGKILDVGCGSGFAVEHCARGRADWQIYGIDVAPTLIQYAKEKRPQFHFELAKAEQLPFPDGMFDVVLSLDTIEHLVDPARALAEARRVLKGNGVLVVLVVLEHHPLFRLIWWLWMKWRGKVWHGAHLRIFTKSSLRKLAEGSGFAIVELRSLFVGMSVLMKAKKG